MIQKKNTMALISNVKWKVLSFIIKKLPKMTYLNKTKALLAQNEYFLVKYSYFCKMETKILIMNIDIFLLFLILFNMLFFKNNKRHLALSFNIVEDANKIDSVYFYSSYFFLFLSTVLIFLLLLFLFNIQKKNN